MNRFPHVGDDLCSPLCQRQRANVEISPFRSTKMFPMFYCDFYLQFVDILSQASLSHVSISTHVLGQTKETTQSASPVRRESVIDRFLVSNCSGRDQVEIFHNFLSIDLSWNCSNDYDGYWKTDDDDGCFDD